MPRRSMRVGNVRFGRKKLEKHRSCKYVFWEEDHYLLHCSVGEVTRLPPRFRTTVVTFGVLPWELALGTRLRPVRDMGMMDPCTT